MLIELRIQDFAIIDRLELRLDAGFIVLTGETGAGKSIIIDAVELLLGGRGDAAHIRQGAAAAQVEAVFRLGPAGEQELRPILAEAELESEDGYLTLSRELRREGRSVARVNGRALSLGLLRELGDRLVDVHGQSEHLSLLRVGEHLHLLDRFAGDEALHEAYSGWHQRLGEVRGELARLAQIEREAARRADLLTYQAEEIERAALQPDEVQALQAERTRLANAEQLAALADEALATLAEGMDRSPSARDLLGQAAHTISALARVDPGLSQLDTEAQDLSERSHELAQSLRQYREKVDFNPRRLEELEERLHLIRTLERKYGGSIASALEHGRTARAELQTIQHATERMQELRQKEKDLLPSLAQAGAELSAARRAAAQALGQGIEAELAALNMDGATFQVDQHWQDDPSGVPVEGRRVAFGPRGLDLVEFLIAPNPGEGLKPLAKIASGGETSRLMLGLKSVLAKADRTPTLIFDEIDQGIGGRVGGVVGEKLWRLSPAHQVLCITHLPQLAAFGDQHVKVEKEVEGGRTMTRARVLTADERREELASMLGGTSEANRRSAAELMERAEKVKGTM